MRKKQIEKIRKDFESMDMSRYHILTYDELLRVNGGSGSDSGDDDSEDAEDSLGSGEPESGESSQTATETTADSGAGALTGDEPESGGHEIENTIEAVANAEVGDTLTRDDGTEVTITQGDIDWAQEHCDSYGKNEEVADSKEAAENAGPATENASESQQVDNSNEAVANAQPCDTITRSDGTEVVLTQEDIDWARDHVEGNSEKSSGGGKADSTREGENVNNSSVENKSESSKENVSDSKKGTSTLVCTVDPSPSVAYFNQRDFSKEFGVEFGNHACAATSLLNEVSEEYTRETTQSMSYAQAIAAMQTAVDSGNISDKDANVNNWQGAANDMVDALAMSGTYTYGGESPSAVIYALDKDGDNEHKPDHFVNSYGERIYYDGENYSTEKTYYDVWDGSIGNVSDVDLATYGLGKTRTLTYSY